MLKDGTEVGREKTLEMPREKRRLKSLYRSRRQGPEAHCLLRVLRKVVKDDRRDG